MHLLLGRARLRLRPRARWHRSHPGDKTSPDQPPAVRAISRPRQGRDTHIVYHAAQSSSRNEPWTPWPGGRRLCVRNSRPRAAVYRAVSQACEACRRRREGRARHRFGREIRVVHRQGHLVDRVRCGAAGRAGDERRPVHGRQRIVERGVSAGTTAAPRRHALLDVLATTRPSAGESPVRSIRDHVSSVRIASRTRRDRATSWSSRSAASITGV